MDLKNKDLEELYVRKEEDWITFQTEVENTRNNLHSCIDNLEKKVKLFESEGIKNVHKYEKAIETKDKSSSS